MVPPAESDLVLLYECTDEAFLFNNVLVALACKDLSLQCLNQAQALYKTICSGLLKTYEPEREQ